MILSSALTAEGACYRQVISDTLDAETIKKAAEIFDSYRERGTILSASMLDDTWVLTNERFRAHLHFRISSPAYLRNDDVFSPVQRIGGAVLFRQRCPQQLLQ